MHKNVDEILKDKLKKKDYDKLIQIGNPYLNQFVAKFIQHDFVLKVNFLPDDGSLLVETNNRDKLFGILPSLFMENDIEVFEITSPDDNLQAVFDYLIGQ